MIQASPTSCTHFPHVNPRQMCTTRYSSRRIKRSGLGTLHSFPPAPSRPQVPPAASTSFLSDFPQGSGNDCEGGESNIAFPLSTRRSSLAAIALTATLIGPASCQQASASKLPGFADRAWESLGGGCIGFGVHKLFAHNTSKHQSIDC